jgi:gamma-glutamyltranspeptidase/glutathione hydrolase
MDDFSVKPGVPNIYGLVGGEANAIEPEKRMLSSMTPTIVLEDGDVKLVLGSPGGSTIITTVLQVILNVMVHEMQIEKAVASPRFHHQWLPDTTRVESSGVNQDILNDLNQMGHAVKEVEALGDVHAVMVEHPNGGSSAILVGASDPRRGGSALGY